MTIRGPTYVDLFAGCGGFSLGLAAAGWDGLFAIEKDSMAFETLEVNLIQAGAPYRDFRAWPAWLPCKPMEISAVLDDRLLRSKLTGLRGEVDLLAGGPPCQGFSVGGARDGRDTRNVLVHRFLEFVRILEPRAVLIENVPGMARPFRSKPIPGVPQSVADQVRLALHELGYGTATEVLDASEFGVPQMRHRLVIMGIRTTTGAEALKSSFGEALTTAAARLRSALSIPSGCRVTARDALDDLDGDRQVVCPDSPNFQSGTYRGKPRSAFAQLMRRGIPTRTIPDSHRFSVHGPRISAMYELAHRTQRRGRLPREFMLQFGTKKDKKVLIDPDRPVSTITTHPDEFIHYARPRNITIREMARLQSFPEDFAFRGRYTINGPRRRFDVARCSQVGNAVPPLLSQALGIAMAEILNQFERPRPAARLRLAVSG